jgi:hypothetical protein
MILRTAKYFHAIPSEIWITNVTLAIAAVFHGIRSKFRNKYYVISHSSTIVHEIPREFWISNVILVTVMAFQKNYGSVTLY